MYPSVTSSQPLSSTPTLVTENGLHDSAPRDSQLLGQNALNIPRLIHSYNEMVSSGSQSKVFTDMYGMMLQIVLNQSDYEEMKATIAENSLRIQHLEAKLASQNGISEKLGIVIRNLPHANAGQEELDYVRWIISEIKPPGVDIHRDVVKAERIGQTNAVKVEIRNEQARASIMKNKKNLKNHRFPIFNNLIIKNLKTDDQMSFENFTHDLLKIIPNGSDLFVSGNGHLRYKSDPYNPITGSLIQSSNNSNLSNISPQRLSVVPAFQVPQVPQPTHQLYQSAPCHPQVHHNLHYTNAQDTVNFYELSGNVGHSVSKNVAIQIDPIPTPPMIPTFNPLSHEYIQQQQSTTKQEGANIPWQWNQTLIHSAEQAKAGGAGRNHLCTGVQDLQSSQ